MLERVRRIFFAIINVTSGKKPGGTIFYFWACGFAAGNLNDFLNSKDNALGVCKVCSLTYAERPLFTAGHGCYFWVLLRKLKLTAVFANGPGVLSGRIGNILCRCP